MRYLRIFLLHCEHIFEHRARSFVWFLISLFNPLLYILFWRGAINASVGWTMSSMISYYFLLTVASAFLMAHIEDDVAHYDIQEGNLVKYLIKPFSYFWLKFFEEIHYRLLQGAYGVVVFSLFYFLFGQLVVLASDPLIVLLSVMVVILAYFLSFVFKMIIGLMAFWLTEVHGLFQLVEMILVIFAGYVIPVELLASPLDKVSLLLPFAYMIYFPVVSFQGKLQLNQILAVILTQLTWLLLLYFLYRLVWRKGMKKFTAVGQ